MIQLATDIVRKNKTAIWIGQFGSKKYGVSPKNKTPSRWAMTSSGRYCSTASAVFRALLEPVPSQGHLLMPRVDRQVLALILAVADGLRSINRRGR
jgi:hypothetical protein